MFGKITKGVGGKIKNSFNRNVKAGKENLNLEEVSNNSKEIKKMVVFALMGEDKKPIKETFEEAKLRLKVTDEDIKLNYKNLKIMFYISLMAGLFCFIGLMYSLVFLASVLGSLSMFSIMLLSFANTFKFSFRMFQIRKQKLCSVNDWWKNSAEWWPKNIRNK